MGPGGVAWPGQPLSWSRVGATCSSTGQPFLPLVWGLAVPWPVCCLCVGPWLLVGRQPPLWKKSPLRLEELAAGADALWVAEEEAGACPEWDPVPDPVGCPLAGQGSQVLCQSSVGGSLLASQATRLVLCGSVGLLCIPVQLAGLAGPSARVERALWWQRCLASGAGMVMRGGFCGGEDPADPLACRLWLFSMAKQGWEGGQLLGEDCRCCGAWKGEGLPGHLCGPLAAPSLPPQAKVSQGPSGFSSGTGAALGSGAPGLHTGGLRCPVEHGGGAECLPNALSVDPISLCLVEKEGKGARWALGRGFHISTTGSRRHPLKLKQLPGHRWVLLRGGRGGLQP